MANVLITGGDLNRSGSISISDIYKKTKESPVGTVRQSILSESQFQSKAGTGWVLAQGQSLSTSLYPELFAAIAATYSGNGYFFGGSGGSFNIPDMRNRYSRMSGTYSLGSCQSNTTSSNCLYVSPTGVSLSGVTTFSKHGCHCHGSGSIKSQVSFDFSCVIHNGCSSLSGPSISFGSSSNCIINMGSCTSASPAVRTVTKISGFSSCFSSSGVSPSCLYRVVTCSTPSLSAGATETRPDSVVLNWFVRVK